jgi:hypothetical protein
MHLMLEHVNVLGKYLANVLKFHSKKIHIEHENQIGFWWQYYIHMMSAR